MPQKAIASATSTIGYLDPWNSTTHNWCSQITGWACDTTDPSKAIQVDLFAPNPYSSGVHSINHVMANTQSTDEAAIAKFCGAATGNTHSYPHRFSFPFPATLANGTPVGIYVYGHALDGTHTALLGHSGTKAACTATSLKPIGPSGYTYCAPEGSPCTLTGTMNVAFGVDGKFEYLTNKTGTIQCTNTTFGGDPAPHITKACFVKASSGSTPTPPSGSGSTSIKVIVGLPGIGSSGNPPQHTTRPVTVELYAPSVTNPGGPGTSPIKTATGTLTYDNGSDNNAGYFVSNTPIGFSGLASGNYQILVKVPQMLYTLAVNAANTDTPHVFTLNANTTTTLDPLVLTSGDVAITSGQLNHLNISDYNLLLSCYGSKAGSSSCPVNGQGPNGINLADLNDDGQVTIVDLNIWLRSLLLLQTNNAQGCSTGDCQGD